MYLWIGAHDNKTERIYTIVSGTQDLYIIIPGRTHFDNGRC